MEDERNRRASDKSWWRRNEQMLIRFFIGAFLAWSIWLSKDVFTSAEERRDNKTGSAAIVKKVDELKVQIDKVERERKESIEEVKKEVKDNLGIVHKRITDMGKEVNENQKDMLKLLLDIKRTVKEK